MPSNHFIFCFPILPILPMPSIIPSIKVFSKDSTVCIRWPKYWSFGFRVSPSNEYSGLISFTIDWFDVLAGQGTLKSHSQQDSLKISILRCSSFFMVQLSYPYMTTGKNTALAIWAFVSKVMSQLLNTLSRFVIAFRAQYDLILML